MKQIKVKGDQVLDNTIKIPVWNYSFKKILYFTEYHITYCYKGKRWNHINIVVNRCVTPIKINLSDWRKGFKRNILEAVTFYRNADQKYINDNSYYQKYLTKDKILSKMMSQTYDQAVKEQRKNIDNTIYFYLLTISKITKRDLLKEYGLLFNKNMIQQFFRWLRIKKM